MRLVSLTVLAAVAMTGSALATEAFIGQVGDANEGLNIQLNQSDDSISTAVIFQKNSYDQTTPNGHDALQVQIGDDNYAYTYQESFYFDHVALSWQEGVLNSSVNVQMTHESNGDVNDTSPDARFKARTIQLGDNNTAVNWQSDQGIVVDSNGLSGKMKLSPQTPKLTLTGDTIPVNGNTVIAHAQNFEDPVPLSFSD